MADKSDTTAPWRVETAAKSTRGYLINRYMEDNHTDRQQAEAAFDAHFGARANDTWF
jgi:hypothetical protein